MTITVRKHTRELIDFLRAEYGAEDVHLQSGGKHNKLKFRCHGSEYSYVVGNPSDVKAIKNIHAEFKRTLGLPISKQSKHALPIEEIEEMATTPKIKAALSTLQQNHALPSEDWQPEPAPETPEIPEAPEDMVETPTPPARIWEIKVCAYKGQSSAGPMVWFIFPPDARDHIRQTYQRVTLQKLDEEHWQITKGGYRKFSKYDKKIKLTYTDPGIEPFGSSAAEAVEANGEILIYLAKENRVPIAQLTGFPKSAPQPPQMKKPAPKPVPPIRLKADPAPPVDSPPVQHVKVTMQQPMLMTTSTLMEQRMLDIIRQIYDIQELCPYRLITLPDGRLVWRAREIG